MHNIVRVVDTEALSSHSSMAYVDDTNPPSQSTQKVESNTYVISPDMFTKYLHIGDGKWVPHEKC